ncbi:MAG: HEAT repeat domain-containing protein [Candidatus Acetothermia bacterium]
MLYWLQHQQSQLVPFVIPAVIALGALLGVLIFAYLVSVWYHVRKRNSKAEKLTEWREQAGLTPDKENICPPSEFQAEDSREHRNFLVQSARAHPAKADKLASLYDDCGYLDRDLSYLKSRRWSRRAGAINRLKALQADQLESFLPALLEDSRLEVRLTAVDAWGELGALVLEDKLIPLFEDHSQDVHQFLCIKLFPVGLSVEALGKLARKEQAHLRKDAAILLGRSGNLEGIELFRNLLEDSVPEVRRHAALALGRVGTGAVIELLELAARDSSAEVRAAAARSLGAIENPEAVESLGEMVTDSFWRVRLGAFISLSKYGDVGRRVINDHRSQFPRLAREATLRSYMGGGSP